MRTVDASGRPASPDTPRALQVEHGTGQSGRDCSERRPFSELAFREVPHLEEGDRHGHLRQPQFNFLWLDARQRGAGTTNTWGQGLSGDSGPEHGAGDAHDCKGMSAGHVVPTGDRTEVLQGVETALHRVSLLGGFRIL